MTRTYNGDAFCLREHLVRLYASLKMMQIDPGMTIDEMEALTLEVLEANKPTEDADVDWQIMHDVSRGTMGIYHSIGEGGDNDGGPTVSINCWPLITHQGGYAPNYTNGVDLVVSPVQQLPAHLLDLKAKTRSRLHYQMAQLAAEPLGHVDPVLMDPDGFLAEGPGWNIFLVRDGVLMTPEPRNSLIGVSRQNTIMLAKQLGIPVEEKNLGRYEAMTADEIFITSTTKALCWAKTWEGQPVGDGKNYPIYDKLMAAWQRHVDCDFVAQAQEYERRLPAWLEKDAKKHRDHQASITMGGGVHLASMGLRPVPNTSLYVSPICLGTMTFGTPVGQEEATAIIKRAAELGVNFIDTANMYEGYTRSVGSRGEASEIIIGNALQALGPAAREGFVIATKVGMDVERDGQVEGGLSAAHIAAECERSLARLQLDTIDIYYAHKPDENGVPLKESIGAFASLIEQGKVRHWAVSNYEPEQLMEVLGICDANNWPRPVMHQPSYSLLNRAAEDELLPLCEAEGIAVAPYQVFEGGLLTGKYQAGEEVPSGSRAAESAWMDTKLSDDALKKVGVLSRVAARSGMPLSDYVLRRSAAVAGVTSLIVGVSRLEQLEAAVNALGGVRDAATHRPRL